MALEGIRRSCKGDWRAHFDPEIVAQALAVYQPETPRPFSLDTGRVAAGQTVVVEGNDGYSLSVCGLITLAYVGFLSAR